MNFTTRIVNKFNFKNKHTDLGDLNSRSFIDWITQRKRNGGAINEATYFTGLRMLSESVGKLPIHLYQNTDKGPKKVSDLDDINILKIRPNPYMAASVFWSTVEVNRVHFGNAYVYINRNETKLRDMWILKTDAVAILIDNKGLFGRLNALWYKYTDSHSNEEYLFHHDEIMHFKSSVSLDGITGVGVRDRLDMMVDGALASQAFMANLNQNGLSAKAVLNYTGDLSEASQKKLIKKLSKFATGATNAGKIVPIPAGMQLTPLDIKLTDAQFVELRKVSALQLAAAMGVKPNHLNDYEKSSYANSEMQNLAFYTDTLLYIVKQYEEEMGYKMLSSTRLGSGYYFKFNVSVILRTDQKTQSEMLKGYVNNGIMRVNEARELLDLEKDEHGDKLVMNGNYIPLELVGTQWGKERTKGGDN